MDVIRRPPYGTSPRVGERGATTHRNILDAALTVIGERGYHNTRVEHIASAAGCSRPSFYQYFSSKGEVFWQLVAEVTEALEDHCSRALDTTPDANGLEALRTWIDDLVDIYLAHAPVFTTFAGASQSGAAAVQRAGAVNQRLGDALVTTVECDAHDEFDRSMLASVTIIVVLRSLHYWRMGMADIRRDRFVAGLARVVHRLQHGAIAGVNLGPTIAPRGCRTPPWPVMPRIDDGRARPEPRETFERLLDAGAVVLPHLGYHRARVEDVVRRAGLSHGTFYRYFDGKDDLFRVLADRSALHMSDVLTSFPDPLTEPGLRTWFDEWVDVYRRHGGILGVWQEITYDSAKFRELSLRVSIEFYEKLCWIMHDRGFGDAPVDALVLQAAIERIPHNTVSMGLLNTEQAVAATMCFLRRSLFRDV